MVYCLVFHWYPTGLCFVPSFVFFFLYTDDCLSIFEGSHIIKIADDSVIVVESESDSSHGPAVDDFMQRCNASFLNINAFKTMEMFINFCKVPLLPVEGKSGQALQIFRD